MPDFMLIEEAPDYFMVQHPNGQQASIAKNALDETQQNEIRSLPKIEKLPTQVNGIAITQPVSHWQPAPSPEKKQNMNLQKQTAMLPQPITPEQNVIVPTQQETTPITQPAQGPQGSVTLTPKEDGFNNQINQLQTQARDANTALQKTMSDTTTFYADKRVQLEKEQMQMQKDYTEGKIDPNHFWNQQTGLKGGFNRVLSMIGLFLGGNAQIRTGINPAQKMLEDAITRDIDAQKTELGKKKTLLDLNTQKYGDLRLAEQATKLDMMNAFQAQLQNVASQTNSLNVKKNVELQTAELGLKIQQMNYEFAKEQTKKQLNSMLGTQIVPDVMIPMLDKDQKDLMVRVAPNQNVMARSKEDADEIKKTKPIVDTMRDSLLRMKELRQQGIGIGGHTPFLKSATTGGHEAQTIQAQLKNQLRQIGSSLRIGEFTDEKILNRIVPDITSINSDKVDAALKEFDSYITSLINNSYASRLTSYNPNTVSFRPGLAK